MKQTRALHALLAARLQLDGAAAFVKSWNSLVGRIQGRLEAIA